MELIFEKSRQGHVCGTLPLCDVEKPAIPDRFARQTPPPLPEVAEVDLVRHYTALSRRAFGVDNGFYPLGSCTMKYNPKRNEDAVNRRGFTDIHPLQPQSSVQGALEAMRLLSGYLCEITGMDAFTLQPAAGAQGEFAALAMIRAYLHSKGEDGRKTILIPDSAHGTNPASAAMNGFQCVNIPSTPDGLVDLDALRAAVGKDTAALMLTNPNTLGLFEQNITQIEQIVHDAGGLLYYDGANLNAVMGIVRPGNMGFDLVHLNLHKTFSTPHGGGGPGSGPVGCKAFLQDFLPGRQIEKTPEGHCFTKAAQSIGDIVSFYGNFLVCLRALCYILTLGTEGLREAAENAVLNANYMRGGLQAYCALPYENGCMHEFVLSLEGVKKESGVTAADIAKSLIDKGIHPPTMYFPLIVPEALMIEPTETESRETLDAAVSVLTSLLELARINPQALHDAPLSTPIGRPDETAAVRKPVLSYQQETR